MTLALFLLSATSVSLTSQKPRIFIPHLFISHCYNVKFSRRTLQVARRVFSKDLKQFAIRYIIYISNLITVRTWGTIRVACKFPRLTESEFIIRVNGKGITVVYSCLPQDFLSVLILLIRKSRFQALVVPLLIHIFSCWPKVLALNEKRITYEFFP